MPPFEDIAWKFVSRVDARKWRCPHCKIEYSGTVTRVKSHLLKIPSKGIAVCAKVPEPISKLMQWLLDEVRGKDDVAWKFVNRLGDNKWHCHYCSEEFFGDLIGVKGHLLKVPNAGISICTEVPDPVRNLMLSLLDEAAEEQRREANGQSSVEPKSRDMLPTLAEVTEEESKSFEDAKHYLTTPEGTTDMAKFTSYEQQGELHETLAKQSWAQHSHDESTSCSTGALVEEVSFLFRSSHGQPYSFLSPCPEEMLMHDLETPAGASSSQHDLLPAVDMNRGSPIMSVQSVNANDEEIRNPKRKVEEPNGNEAVIRKEMEIESAASSVWKKPRNWVERWLEETERGQANVETLPRKEEVETLTGEVEELEKKLPQTQLIEDRDAKGDTFLLRELTGKAIHENIKLIWKHLTENHTRKLGIYGMGGVGKTTVMTHIHNRLLKDATFDGVAFITVSQDFSIYKLQSDIWKALNFGVMEDEHEKKQEAILSEHLERKKNCVLILDDVWRHFKLPDVGIPNRAGLKVIITTRFFEVCSRMDCEEMIKIQPLDREEAWKLFMEELGPKPLTNIQFEKVAPEIANRCAGLPLAINTIASCLRGEKNFFVWQDVLNKMEGSHTKHTEMGDIVLPVLARSYEHLLDPQVKQCFLFCALLPKDVLFPQMQLIEYFIDEGLLDEADTREEQYCRGLAIVHKLQNACLLEVDHGCVRMHYLIKEMALRIISTAYMAKAGQGLRRIPDGEDWTKDLEKVSLMQGCIKDIPPDLSPNCPKLSTLLLNESLNLKNVQIQGSFFKKMRVLKVLNLSQCRALTELPESLLKLANLRALVLRGCRVLCHIPCLGKLKSLRKLDVNGCFSLLEVKGLEELRNLRYLDLAGSGIERLSKGTLRRMVNLQYLNIAGSVKVNAKEVIKLKALERLKCYFGKVDNFNKYVRIIEESGRHDYSLIVDQENRLWSVSAYVYSDPKIFPENKIMYDEDYHCHKSVEIRSSNYAMARVGEEMNNNSILILGDVELFILGNWRGVTNLSGMGRLRCLKVLRIKEWDNLVVLFGGAGVDKEEVCNTRDSPAFPSLEVLEIQGCSKLKYLFGHESRFSLPLLREVSISRCEGIEGMTTSVASPLQLGGPAFPRLTFPRLESIILENCGNMKRVVVSGWYSHFPNLKTIEVKYCNSMNQLLLHEGFRHLPNLECIEVHGCEGIEIISRPPPQQKRSVRPRPRLFVSIESDSE